VVPFRLQYALGRRQRLAVEFTPHLPACAAALGFTCGIAYLALVANVWFLVLLALPAVVCRGLIAFLIELAVVPLRPIDVLVESDRLGLLTADGRVWMYLDGVIQVFRTDAGDSWTLLHINGSVLTIPDDAILPEQLDYLKAFALRGWRQRYRSEPAR
jgi:hypothetical protein